MTPAEAKKVLENLKSLVGLLPRIEIGAIDTCYKAIAYALVAIDELEALKKQIAEAKMPKEDKREVSRGNHLHDAYDKGFIDGWNSGIRNCRPYIVKLEQENKRMREALEGILGSTCVDYKHIWSLAKSALAEGGK